MSRRRARVPKPPSYGDRQSCPEKITFFAEKTAKQRARELSEAGASGDMHAYECSNCGYWHLGHAAGEATGIRHADRWFWLPARRDLR